MNPEKMEDFHMDFVGNPREHYQESDLWLCPNMWRTPKCQFHREDAENPLELWGSPEFLLANTYVFFLFNGMVIGHGWFTNVYYLEKRMDESTKLMSPTAQRI